MISKIESIEQYNEEIEKNDGVLFYFSHEKCNVCEVLKPKIEDLLGADFQNIKMFYCDTLNLPELAAQNRVFTVPTIIAYFTGRETIRKSRNIGLSELKELIERPYQMIF